MTIAFNYKIIQRPKPYLSEHVPAIPVTLIGANTRIDIIGLLDSGADFSAIPKEIAEVLGLDLSSKPEDIGGIGGDVAAIKKRMQINVNKSKEDYTFQVEVYAVEKLEEDFPVLIGRQGFFEQFKITFTEAERKIHLKKYNLRIG